MPSHSIRIVGVVLAGFLVAAVPARGATETVVYSFKGGADGAYPYGGLIDAGGTLYGTTDAGGEQSHNCRPSGCGTVFSLTTGGAENVVYAFERGNDGDGPLTSLLNFGGTLYGTTAGGGGGTCSGGCGTVFSVTTGGVENILYAFKGNIDRGIKPYAGLIAAGGKLYGTTTSGGASTTCDSGCGTVFSLTTAGKEKVVYSFQQGSDGGEPSAGLIDEGGILYGTASEGGGGSCEGGCGAVFSMTRTGAEKVVYAFQGGTDAQEPTSGLFNAGARFFGVSALGGSANCFKGCGVVFSVTTAGVEKVIYSFKSGTDGHTPNGPLIEVGDKFYGTTESGGTGASCSGGCGTIFSVAKSGAEKVLYSFQAGSDGCEPYAGLINVGGTLYGTTAGCGANGYGTVFSFKP